MEPSDDDSANRDPGGKPPKSDDDCYQEIWDIAKAWAWKSLRSEDEAEDVAQDVGILANELLKKDPPGLDRHEPFEPWVYTVVWHRVADHIRAQGTRDKAAAGYEARRERKGAADNDIARQLATWEEQTVVYEAIQSLPPICGELHHAVKVEGLSQQEAAERFGLNKNTVHGHLTATYAAIRRALAKYREEGR